MPQGLVLVAEDNPVNQKITVRQLEKLGYRADAVADGRKALEALQRIPYDIVLMDCQMPEMDGYEATVEIRRREGNRKHTLIVAMTAHALERDREKCLSVGMDDYIAKPVKVEDLAKVLERVSVASSKSQSDEVISQGVVAPVDLNRLYESMGEQPEELFEILGIYLDQMSDSLKRLDVAIESGDAGEIDLIAHNCCGVSANCGMTAVVAPLRELERMGRENCLQGSKVLGVQVSSEFARIKSFLKENLAHLPV